MLLNAEASNISVKKTPKKKTNNSLVLKLRPVFPVTMKQTKLKSNSAEVTGGTSADADDITAAKDELKKYQGYLPCRE